MVFGTEARDYIVDNYDMRNYMGYDIARQDYKWYEFGYGIKELSYMAFGFEGLSSC